MRFAVAQLPGQFAQPRVGGGEPGSVQQARIRERACGQPHRAVTMDALEHGPDPELHAALDPLGAQPQHGVSPRVASRHAPGDRALHLDPVRTQMLIAVSSRRQHDQPVPQLLHRPRVVVAEALLEQVGHPVGTVEVKVAIVERRAHESAVGRASWQHFRGVDGHAVQLGTAERGSHRHV